MSSKIPSHAGTAAPREEVAAIPDVLPPALVEAAREEIRTMPAEDLLFWAKNNAREAGHIRAVPENAGKIREHLLAMIPEGATRLPVTITFLVDTQGLQMRLCCVLSERALTDGYAALAATFGEARLLLAMLLDKRNEVRALALRKIKNHGKANDYKPAPKSLEVARAAIRKTFEPFIGVLEHLLVAAPTTDAERLKSLEAENKELRERLQRERTRAKDDADRIRKDRNAAQAKVAELTDKLNETLEALSRTSTESDAVVEELKFARNRVDRLERMVRRMEQEAEADAIAWRARMAKLRASYEAAQQEEERKLVEQAFVVVDASAVEESGEQRAESGEQRAESGEQRAEKAQKRKAPTAAPKPVVKTSRQAEFLALLEEDESAARVLRPSKRTEAAQEIGIDPDERVAFLLDGHNIIHCTSGMGLDKTRTDGSSHHEVREEFEAMLAGIPDIFPKVEIDLFWDGQIANVKNLGSNIVVRYSGGEGEHRADRDLMRHMDSMFMAHDVQSLPEKIFVVSNDQDIVNFAHSRKLQTLSTERFGYVLQKAQ